MLKQFGGDETKIEHGAATSKDLGNVEIDHCYGANMDMLEDDFNINAGQCSTLEKLKTQVKMSREPRAMMVDDVGSGKSEDPKTASPSVQNSESEIKAPKVASMKDGLNEHLHMEREQFIRSVRNLENGRARSSVFSNVDKTNHVKKVCIRFEEKTRLVIRNVETDEFERETREKMGLKGNTTVYMTHEGRKIGWRQLGEIQADGLVEMTVAMRGDGKKKKGGEAL